MAETNHGLHMQATHALGRSAQLRQALSASANTSLNDSTGTVEISIELLRSLEGHLGTSAGLIQKQNHRIEDQANTIQDLQK